MKDAKNLARTKILLSLSVVSQCYSDGGVFLYSAFFVLIFAQVFDLSSFPSFIIPILLSLFPLSLPPCGTRTTLQRAHVAMGSVGWVETWPHLPDGGPSGRNKEVGALTHLSLEGELGWGRQSKTDTKLLLGPDSALGDFTGVKKNPAARPDLFPS